MVTAADRAIFWARRQIGEHETPDGSNSGPFVVECQRATWLAGTGWPWCIAFIQEAYKQAGQPLPYLGAGAYDLLDWFRKNRPDWVVPLANARPGAIVIYNVGAGHGALLDQTIVAGGQVVTVGGNEANAVRRVPRDRSLVRGVIQQPQPKPPVKPAVPAEPAPVQAPVKPPKMYEVVTAADGQSKIVYVSGANAIAKRLQRLTDRFGQVTIRPKKANAK